jgi:hypothetical protein
LISVPLGRVSEALPGFMPPSVAGAYSMGAFLMTSLCYNSRWVGSFPRQVLALLTMPSLTIASSVSGGFFLASGLH